MVVAIFAGVEPEVVVAGVATDVPAGLIFLGTFFTGVAVVFVVLVAAAAGFFTGVALVAVVAAFAGVAEAGFFVVDWAVLDTLSTLAGNVSAIDCIRK